jgi:hypothetical protein
MLHGDMLQVTNPFRPFRIVTTNGETYDVRHREGFILTNTSITLGLLPAPGAHTFERTVILDLFHIIRLEPLPQQAPLKSNGEVGG